MTDIRRRPARGPNQGAEDPIAEDRWFLPPSDPDGVLGIGLAIVGLIFLVAALIGGNDRAEAEAAALRTDLAQCRAQQGGVN